MLTGTRNEMLRYSVVSASGVLCSAYFLTADAIASLNTRCTAGGRFFRKLNMMTLYG